MAPTTEPTDATAFSTDDPAVAHQFIVDAYGDRRLRFAVDPGRFRLASRRRDLGPFQIDECELDGTAAFSFTPVERVLVSRVRAGARQIRDARRGDLRFGPGDLALIGTPGTAVEGAVVDIRAQVLTLTPAALAAAASRDPGVVPAAVAFTALEPHSRAHGRVWRQIVDGISKLFDDADTRAARLIVGRSDRLLAAVTLATFEHGSATGDRGGDPRDGHPQTLRLAIAYIEAGPDRDMTIADVARAAHVTSRSVQHAFRRHLGTTPMAYLRRVRLDHTHQDLLAANSDTGATVARIALDWGFGNPSRFAGYYRDAYGCLPSKTLAQ